MSGFFQIISHFPDGFKTIQILSSYLLYDSSRTLNTHSLAMSWTCFTQFVRKVFSLKKLLSGKFWGFAPLPCAIKIKGHWPITSVCVLKTSDSKSFNYLERHFWYTSALTSLYAVTPGLTLLRKKKIIISESNFEHQIPRPGSWQPEFPLERRLLPHQVSSTSSYTSDHF